METQPNNYEGYSVNAKTLTKIMEFRSKISHVEKVMTLIRFPLTVMLTTLSDLNKNRFLIFHIPMCTNKT